jgi:hypothetical protein
MMRTDVQGPAVVRSVMSGSSEDRCDRCCAAGCVSFLLRSGLDLVFCAHHARQFERELRRSGALVGTEAHQDALVW